MGGTRDAFGNATKGSWFLGRKKMNGFRDCLDTLLKCILANLSESVTESSKVQIVMSTQEEFEVGVTTESKEGIGLRIEGEMEWKKKLR